jgi:glycine dehydrogenase subunit 1
MRYLPLTEQERARILKLCNVSSFEELTRDIPDELRLRGLLDFEPALSEPELRQHLHALASKNAGARMTCHLGQGVYDHTWPVAVDQLTNRGEFFTAYTPYQPELSQGTLQTIFEFQSMVADLYGQEVANASLYDGATAVVEAALMAARLQNIFASQGGATQQAGGVLLVSEGTYDRVRDVLRTYLEPLNIAVETWWADGKSFLGTSEPRSIPDLKGRPVVGAVLQSPNKWGLVEDWNELTKLAGSLKTKSIGYVAHPHSLAVFQSPGEAGVDIVAGEGQPLGLPMGFGGPHLGLFACKMQDVRQMPGRLVGATEDVHGSRAFCITLSTREQHIRREKATSNICSNQNLMALRTSMYLTLMGPKGLKQVAETSRSAAHHARELLKDTLAGKYPEIKVLDGELFNEVCILVPPKHSLWQMEVEALAHKTGILPGCRVSVPGSSGFVAGFVAAFTEKHTLHDIERLVKVLCEEEV